jgi:23S rRNA pseudouridine955/2504/2580 synthase
VKNIQVLYEDDTCAVFDKPAGLAVQGGAGVKTSLDNLLEAEWGARPFLVHRLDKDTSGALLVAKSREAAACFSGLIEGRLARKEYIAVCSAPPDKALPAAGVIDDCIVVKGREQTARTRFSRLSPPAGAAGDGGTAGNSGAFGSGTVVLSIELGTGRMHQIRRHLALIGCPVLGDDKYGDFALNKKLRKERGLKHLLLHARRLCLPAVSFRGINTQAIDVVSDTPAYFFVSFAL